MNINGKFLKVAKTENSIVVGTFLPVNEITHENIVYIANFYGINTNLDKFSYHVITQEGAQKRGCKYPVNNFIEFIEIFD